MKYTLKKLVVVAALCLSAGAVYSQNLPANSISNGPVPYTTPNQWQSYSYTYTATTTGANYVGFAFRQVPAFWTFTNVDVYTTNPSNNLMYNGNMVSGGQVPNNYIYAPTGWGVWYQTGTTPSAAGSWQNGGNPAGTGGVWYDGAVQSYDGIYQAFNATAGTTYTVTFQLEGDNPTSNPTIAVGVYAGACGSGTTVFNCTPGAGFTALATPDQTAGAVTPGVTPPPPPTPEPPPGPVLVTSVSGSTPVAASTIDTTQSTTVTGGTIQADATTQTLPQNISISGISVVDQNGNQITLSGTISGTGSLTIANSATGGGVVLSGQNTYTGSTTINSGATLNNQGSIATSSGVTNNGTFTNSGTAPGVTNTGTFDNSGTAGAVTNSGTFTNSGTAGDVTNTNIFTNLINGIINSLTNSGTATNSGTVTTTVTNTGTIQNDGTVTGTVTNTSGTFTNTGATGDVTNAGTFTNTGAVGSVNNSGTFTQSSGTSGSITNSSIANISGGATADVTNTGTFTQSGGTTTTINNLGAFNLSGGSTGNVTNSGAFTMSGGSTGNVTNSGTFTVTQPGTIGSVNNSGILDLHTAGNVTVAGYTQTANGRTILSIAPGTIQHLTSTGPARLNGGIGFTAASGPYQYGVYNFLTASSVSGSYSLIGVLPDNISPLGVGIVQDATSVSLKITPSAAYTMAAVDANVSNIANMNNLQAASLGGTLNYDCNLFGENNACISTGVRTTSDSAGSLKGGNVVLGYRLTPNWRIGMFADQTTNSTTMGNVKQSTSPAVGMFANWQEDARGYGWGVQSSLAMISGSMDISRAGSQYSEAAKGTSSTGGQAFQVKTTYAMPVTSRDTVTPYAGLRYTKINNNNYTESGATFPITYGNISQTTTDAIAGINLSHNFGRFVGFVSAGVIQNLSYNSGTLTGSSDIIGLNSINSKLPGSGYTSTSLGMGVSYDLAKNQYLGLSIGWQEKSLLNTSVISGAATYTIGF